MKSFYSPVVESQRRDSVAGVVVLEHSASRPGDSHIHIRSRARIAVYDAPSAAPRVVEVDPCPVAEFIDTLASKVHELARAEGARIPYSVIREITENFIHSGFAEPVVSILDSGSTVRFADQGPGIADKERVLLPGFTTARGEMKKYIRGVGSGLPLVRDYLAHSGGSLAIEDNLGAGSVVTIYAGPDAPSKPAQPSRHPANSMQDSSLPTHAVADRLSLVVATDESVARPRLTARQQHVLAVVLEVGLAGPSVVSKELGVGLSTAYRDLAFLEEAGLIASEGGKRTLTPDGVAYLRRLT